MEGGMEASMLGIKPSDAQLLESRAFSVEEVCRRYRVPPFMIGHTQKSTSWGTGIEQQMIGFLTFALRPWLKRIEQAVRKYLLKPEERAKYFAKFDVKALLRTDSAARAEYLSTMTQNGIMTRAEAREEEGLPFIPGSDELTAQVNLAPLATLGSAQAEPTRKSSRASRSGTETTETTDEA
jgi:HK97 family phage portal protein